jgi:hypothetical protein
MSAARSGPARLWDGHPLLSVEKHLAAGAQSQWLLGYVKLDKVSLSLD